MLDTALGYGTVPLTWMLLSSPVAAALMGWVGLAYAASVGRARRGDALVAAAVTVACLITVPAAVVPPPATRQFVHAVAVAVVAGCAAVPAVGWHNLHIGHPERVVLTQACVGAVWWWALQQGWRWWVVLVLVVAVVGQLWWWGWCHTGRAVGWSAITLAAATVAAATAPTGLPDDSNGGLHGMQSGASSPLHEALSTLLAGTAALVLLNAPGLATVRLAAARAPHPLALGDTRALPSALGKGEGDELGGPAGADGGAVEESVAGDTRSRDGAHTGMTGTFYAAMAVVVGGVEYPLLWRAFGAEPFTFVIASLFNPASTPHAALNLAMCAWWVVVIVVLVVGVPHHGGDWTGNLLLRKCFHFAAIIMFLPPLAWAPLAPGPPATATATTLPSPASPAVGGGPLPLLPLAMAVAGKALVVLELARAGRVAPHASTDALHRVMMRNVDHRDAGVAILTHLYLLFGCAVPMWCEGSLPTPLHLPAAAGVLALGCGDAAAAVVGIVTRRHWGWGGVWPCWHTRKTVQGSIGYAVAVVAVAVAGGLLPTTSVAPAPTVAAAWWSACLMGVVGAMVEAVTTTVDNLTLPAITWAVGTMAWRWITAAHSATAT